MISQGISCTGGSSPLARGLRAVSCRTVCRCGIIPARAGFTRPASPLTRGQRIIPARAGFTISVDLDGVCAEDHPRSRGVYDGADLAPVPDAGSSPLARGLPPSSRRGKTMRRIIPARAGFTRRSLPLLQGGEDHPRSRGVYGASCDHPGCEAGSSPLARGLLEGVGDRRPRLRIIPARAGFTPRPGPARPGARDHPRSRGVYRIRGNEDDVILGSSPLARGLRRVFIRRLGMARIIPARAGFTASNPGTGWSRGDHPRSRGVYFGLDEDSRIVDGSSPLARGLRFWSPHRGGVIRIIPARAGFTDRRPVVAEFLRDHPRSRGVYGEEAADRAPYGGIIPARAGFTDPGDRPDPVRPGSSPLARGLRLDSRPHGADDGIIPARAGFT